MSETLNKQNTLSSSVCKMQQKSPEVIPARHQRRRSWSSRRTSQGTVATSQGASSALHPGWMVPRACHAPLLIPNWSLVGCY